MKTKHLIEEILLKYPMNEEVDLEEFADWLYSLAQADLDYKDYYNIKD